jgi:hypothetical protein
MTDFVNPYGTINYGKDHNYYSITAVDGYDFKANCDIVIRFTTQGASFINLGSLSTQAVQYSFNGITVHGDLTPTTPSAAMMFDNRVVCKIWFRIAPGSSASTVRVEAWGN